MTVRVARDESGSAIVEFIWLALILLVPLVYVVLAVFDTQRAAFAATAAARSAGRAFVTAPSQRSAYARARLAAHQAFRDQGIRKVPRMRISCHPHPAACLEPGSTVTVVVIGRAALPLTPIVFGGQAPSIRVESSHTEPYGDFREARP